MRLRPGTIYQIGIILIIILANAGNSAAHRYTNVALEGGGIRGIAYAGAIEELEKRGILDSIRNISGTSVGAMAGCLLSVGYDAAAMKELLFSLRVQSFNDGRWFFIGGQWRM